MSRLDVTLPEDLDRRLREFLDSRGENLEAFVARALDEQIARDSEVDFLEEQTEKIRRGLADIEAGRFYTSDEAKRILRERLGLPEKS